MGIIKVVHSRFLQHSGGSKAYEIMLLKNTDLQKGVVVTRWGGRGVMLANRGKLEVHPFASFAQADRFYVEKLNEKYSTRDGGQYRDSENPRQYFSRTLDDWNMTAFDFRREFAAQYGEIHWITLQAHLLNGVEPVPQPSIAQPEPLPAPIPPLAHTQRVAAAEERERKAREKMLAINPEYGAWE